MFKFKAGLDLELAGMFATIALLVTAGLQPVFGVWADHGHQRRFVLIGTALASLGMLYGTIGLYIGAGDDAWVYLALFGALILVKLGQGLFHPAGAGLAGTLNSGRRATLLAAFVAMGLAGFAFSQMLFAAVYDGLDGQTHWLLIPAAVVVLAGVIWLRPTHQSERRPIEFRQIGAALHAMRGPLVTLYFVQALLAFVHLGLFFLMPEFVRDRGYPEWLVDGGAWCLFIIGAVALMVPMGWLADRMGRKRVIVALTGGSLLAFYLMVGPAHLPTPLFCLVVLASGATLNTVNPIALSLGQHLAPKHASVISGVLMGMAWAFGSSAQWLMGALAGTDLSFAGSLKVLGLALFPAFGLALLLPQDEPVDKPTAIAAELTPSPALAEPVGDLGVETD